MIDKNEKIIIVNKFGGTIGYDVPDLGIHRDFWPHEKKEVTFNELEKLSFLPGGKIILRDYLEIMNREAAAILFGKQPEPEYYYSNDDIIELMTKGTLEQFLDCLDFAPESILENIKDIAVNLPLNDMTKREAIKEKLGFDVTKAIEVKNTKYDNGEEDKSDVSEKTIRRTAPLKNNVTSTPVPTGRRYKSNKE